VKLGEKAVRDIQKKGKLPIVCGGTGFYIDVLLYGLPQTVAPDWKLRQRFDRLSADALFKKLKKVDPARAKNIDPHNKRRLIRALEIAQKTGAPVPPLSRILKYNVLKIGVKRGKKELRKRIHDRLLSRMKQGMVKEVKQLHNQGVSWQKLDDFGLEYRFISLYLKGELSKEEMLTQLEIAIWHYAKRQMTWFKRDKEIKWLNNEQKVQKIVKEWLFDIM
jgi:tRNA dimethylallyltransferase